MNWDILLHWSTLEEVKNNICSRKFNAIIEFVNERFTNYIDDDEHYQTISRKINSKICVRGFGNDNDSQYFDIKADFLDEIGLKPQ